ncbi:hypothetical protein MK489_14695 [Myxococcota bacterium]|nr:hypothetical protein [Myxococcota bacterium]
MKLDPIDWAVGLGLVAAVALCLQLLPHPVGHSDEGYFLQHARRILMGQAAFRDFHEQYTPLAYYLMALPMALFGISNLMTTLVMTAVHAGITLLMYVVGRQLGLSRALAGSGACLHLALSFPAWPMATGHWFAALFSMLILESLSRQRTVAPVGVQGLFAAGLLTGAVTSMQHPKGVLIAVAVAAFIVFDWGVERFGQRERNAAALGWRALAYGVGILLVGGAVLASLWLRSGIAPVIHQLVVEPLGGYNEINDAAWGDIPLGLARLSESTFPQLLKCLPLLIPLIFARSVAAWRRGDFVEVRRSGLLGFYGSGAVAATLYNPDLVHIAFIAAPLFVLLAATGQWVLTTLARITLRPGLIRMLEALIVVGVLLGSVLHLDTFIEDRWKRFPVSAATAYGTVEFWSESEAELVAAVREAVARSPEPELLCHPTCPSYYLLTGTVNPTPYDLVFFPELHQHEHLQEIIEILETRELAHVVLLGLFQKHDPVVDYVRRNYTPVHGARATGTLYRRKPEAG